MPEPTARTTHHAPIELIPAAPQAVWGVPAVVNFTLGGLGAGFYVGAALAAAGGAPGAMSLAAWLAPALVLAGFVAVAAEAGRPLRGLRVLRRVATSWMSRELWLGGAFVLLALSEATLAAPALRPAAAVAATGLVLAQGFVLARARAVAAWNVPVMPVVFAASAAVSGTGLLALAELTAGRPAGREVLSAALVSLVLGMLVWLGFLTWSADRVFLRATAPLREGPLGLELLAAGYLAPLALVALGLALPSWSALPTALAALLMIAGQLRARAALILTAGQRRPLTLATLTLRRRSP
jgi:anaerobic dimethyl sulfoxide reductase subunit C (anchor subunit)